MKNVSLAGSKLKTWRRVAALLAVTLAAFACGQTSLPLPPILEGRPSYPPTRTPFQPIPFTPTPAPTLTPTPPPSLSLWAPAYLPAALAGGLSAPPGSLPVVPAASPEQADLALKVDRNGEPVSRWVYALAAPFPTLEQGTASDEIRRAWQGESHGPFGGRPLLLDESTLGMFTALWGAPAAGAVQVLGSADLLGYAWEHQPAWALIPFEAVEARWKILEVDGQSPLRKDFDPAAYSLTVPVVVESRRQPGALVVPASNRDPGRLTTVALTGVTALVRATAFTMEQRGVLYPGKDIGDWLRQADITHISNEVPFAQNCPYPNPVQEGVRFCSDPRYIQLLEDVGTDIVELTGDHFQDWGESAMLYTLELYRQRGWPYYGGGANLDEARRAVIIEHNGNRLAFIGCNGKGGGFAQAAARHPGAGVCDYGWMQAEIARLRAEGYLPIATFQHFEYYTYQAQPNQVRDFGGVAQAGAVVVSGSQAHQPQAFEFVGSSLIHYGLGNLFFDQYDVSPATRQGFIDRHVFYAGRYLGVELLPILFVDYARARPMTTGERADLLQSVFRASGW